MTSVASFHIVQGDTKGDKEWIDKAAQKGLVSSGKWIVPKGARIGDDVAIYVGHLGLYATAVIHSTPVKRRDWVNRYGAALGQVQLIDPSISLGYLREKVPDLTWAIYPRSITTPSPTIAAKLRRMIEQRRREGIGRLRQNQLSTATLAELRAIAVSASSPVAGKRSRNRDERIRAEAIRRYALRRSMGYCESCAGPAPFLAKDGSPFLEVHHMTRVTDDGPDHPENVAALCPNCHRRAHSSKDSAKFSATLAKAIAKIEATIASRISRA